jgi:fucose permease
MGGGNLASTLTFGQFIKAIASFLAPYLAMWGATQVIPSFGYDWRVLFAIYFVVGILAAALLAVTPIEEEKIEGKASTFAECIKLLGTPIVLLSFFGIMCHVGIDVGTNTTAPKILMERLGMTLNDAAFATSLYFYLPYHRMSYRFLLPACATEPYFLHHQHRNDGSFNVRSVYRYREMGALHSYRSRRLWKLKYLLHLFRSGSDIDA